MSKCKCVVLPWMDFTCIRRKYVVWYSHPSLGAESSDGAWIAEQGKRGPIKHTSRHSKRTPVKIRCKPCLLWVVQKKEPQGRTRCCSSHSCITTCSQGISNGGIHCFVTTHPDAIEEAILTSLSNLARGRSSLITMCTSDPSRCQCIMLSRRFWSGHCNGPDNVGILKADNLSKEARLKPLPWNWEGIDQVLFHIKNKQQCLNEGGFNTWAQVIGGVAAFKRHNVVCYQP